MVWPTVAPLRRMEDDLSKSLLMDGLAGAQAERWLTSVARPTPEGQGEAG